MMKFWKCFTAGLTSGIVCTIVCVEEVLLGILSLVECSFVEFRCVCTWWMNHVLLCTLTVSMFTSSTTNKVVFRKLEVIWKSFELNQFFDCASVVDFGQELVVILLLCIVHYKSKQIFCELIGVLF